MSSRRRSKHPPSLKYKLLLTLRKEGVNVLSEIETYEYGKFAHILDCEGNKVELWEPIDSVFDDYYKGKTIY